MKASELLKKSNLKEELKEKPKPKETNMATMVTEGEIPENYKGATAKYKKEIESKGGEEKVYKDRELLSEEEIKILLAKGEIEPGKQYKPKHALSKIALLCEIDHKERQKVYDKESQFYGSVNFKLILGKIYNLPENKRPDWIYAFKETILLFGVDNEKTQKDREKVWNDIEKDLYLGKKYTLYCLKNKKGFKLYDWLEHTN